MERIRQFRSLPGKVKRKVIVRFLVFQIPDGLLLIIILTVLRSWVDIPAWLFWAIIGLWVMKFIFWFPFAWPVYKQAESGAGAMIGAHGIVERTLAPSGYVRVRGELWQARSAEKGCSMEVGMEVRVKGIKGLVLTVEPLDGSKTEARHIETKE